MNSRTVQGTDPVESDNPEGCAQYPTASLFSVMVNLMWRDRCPAFGQTILDVTVSRFWMR